MPYKNFTPSELTSSDVNTYLMNQSVMTFDDASARASALTLPVEGMVTYLKDTNKTYQYDGANWLEIVKFDSAGRYQNSNQPMFFVMKHQGTTTSAGNKITFPNVVINVGGHWSTVNNRFTAPVTGYYEFNFSLLNTQTSGFSVGIRKNGSALPNTQSPTTYSNYQYIAGVAVSILQLSVNDYIELWCDVGINHGYHNMFVGKLIG